MLIAVNTGILGFEVQQIHHLVKTTQASRIGHGQTRGLYHVLVANQGPMRTDVQAIYTLTRWLFRVMRSQAQSIYPVPLCARNV